MLRKLAIAAAFATGLISCTVPAQVLGTGAYPFASFDNPGFDSINLGNLNTRFSIPIVQKTGRGLPFSYTLQYEGLVWTPVVGTGTTTWVPDAAWGFTGLLNGSGFAGYVTYKSYAQTCGSGTGGKTQRASREIYSGFVFHDGFGANHPFSYENISNCSDGSGGGGSSGSALASDASGYTLLNAGTQVEARNGTIITPGTAPNITSATSQTDSNGNKISFGGTNGTFTDTLGTTALTISGSSPVTFTYAVVHQSGGATTASATLYYKSYTVQTNFGCSGIVEYGATTVNLVDHIALADGSTYSFTYEKTPGTTSGAVTGRLASITLPSSGSISYTYSGGCSSAGGIMADGTTAGLSRITTDSTNPRTYTRATVNANATSTTLQDEKGNQTVLQFTNYGGDFYETHRQMYQGSVSGTPLLEGFSCYNNAASPCDGVALSEQITASDVVERLNGGSEAVTNSSYDTYGNFLTLSKLNGTTLLYTTTNTYNSLSEPLSSVSKDPSNNVISSATYGYDETTTTVTSGLPQHVAVSGTRGNQTSAHVTYSGSSTLNTTTAYYDTGTPASSTTPNGTTTYSYDPTQTFAMQTSLPTPSSGVSLSNSATYDAASGAILSATGMNAGQTTTVNNYDPFLRPTEITQPNSGQITYTYTPTQTSVSQTLGTGQSAQQSILYDAYGRPSRQEVYNGQSTNSYYQTDTCYDATGLPDFVSIAYQSTGFNAAKQCSGTGASYLYDALRRPTSIITSDGTATIQYTNRAVLTTDVNGVRKITQYDVLGRITGVCELTSTALNGQSPTACGMDISGTGFVTSYAYALAAHTTTVTQGTQTRTFVTDDLGRTTSVTEPERGTTTYAYTYNSTGLSVVRTRPTANQTNSSVTTTTTTQYDSLGRPVSVNYSDGTPSKGYGYDSAIAGGWPNASSVTNAKGQLAGSGTGTGPTWTGQEFSYDIMGNVTQMWQCTASTCGTPSLQLGRPLSFTYDLMGHLAQYTDVQTGAINYGLSPAAEITSITNETFNDSMDPPQVLSNVTNGPFGPISYQLGSGIGVAHSYDSLGRPSGGYDCRNSLQVGCSGGSVVYDWTTRNSGLQVLAASDTVQNQSVTYGYDAFNRLASASGTTQSFTYAYDRWGNRLSQTPTQGTGPSPSYSINAANNQIVGLSYDAAGNLLNDGYHSYSYDAEGNLLQVDGGATATYVYDAQNHRVSIKTSTGTFESIFDFAGRPISVWASGSLTPVSGRIYAGTHQVAYRPASGGTYYDYQDYVGTERTRTDWAGNVVATYQSLPWGDGYNPSVAESHWDQNNSHYAQLQHDSESDTEHAQFRQYSSAQGRWMSPDPYDGSYDPSNPQSLNRYSYALNNPLASVDPSGLCPGHSKSVSCSSAGGGDDDGTIDGIDEFDFIQIPVYGNGFGEFPDQGNPTFSSPVTSGQFAGSQMVGSLTMLSFGWGYEQIGTGFDFLGDSIPIGGSGSGGEGGAPNNTPKPSFKDQFKKAALNYLCGTSVENEITQSMVDGAVTGGVTGALEGGIGGGILTAGPGGVPGAILGGWVGGVFGAAGGIFHGAEMAAVCSVFHVY